MNWLIQGKMFTYFYNKFRPVNRMYYVFKAHRIISFPWAKIMNLPKVATRGLALLEENLSDVMILTNTSGQRFITLFYRNIRMHVKNETGVQCCDGDHNH
jgi:endoglucanase Acf2